MLFTYKSKGTADDWTNDTIEAEDENDAIAKLDKIYGIQRDKDGNQTNGDMIEVELVKGGEHDA